MRPVPGSRPFELATAKNGDALVATISGEITELADLAPLAALACPHLILDVGGVVYINSRGVMRWLTAMKTLSASCQSIELVHVTHVLLCSYAMIRDLFGRGVIRSVQLDYFCDRCGGCEVVELKRDSDFPDGAIHVPTGPVCRACGGATVVDVLLLPSSV